MLGFFGTPGRIEHDAIEIERCHLVSNRFFQ